MTDWASTFPHSAHTTTGGFVLVYTGEISVTEQKPQTPVATSRSPTMIRLHLMHLGSGVTGQSPVSGRIHSGMAGPRGRARGGRALACRRGDGPLESPEGRLRRQRADRVPARTVIRRRLQIHPEGRTGASGRRDGEAGEDREAVLGVELRAGARRGAGRGGTSSTTIARSAPRNAPCWSVSHRAPS